MAKISKKTMEEALTAVNKEYFASIVALLVNENKQKDLTFIKTPVYMPDGGIYLVSILHVDGPKVDLSLLGTIAESQNGVEGKDEDIDQA